MIRSRQARPSICGMWTSSVTTSGWKLCEPAPAPRRPLRANSHLEVGLVGEDLAEQLPHQRGIVDHQKLDHTAPASPPRLRTRRAGRARRGSAVRRDRAPARSVPARSRLMTPLHQARRSRRSGRAPARSRRRRMRSTSETLSTISPARWRSVRTTTSRRRFAVAGGRHVEAPALVDHRQHLAAQIDHALEELRRLRNPGDLVRHARRPRRPPRSAGRTRRRRGGTPGTALSFADRLAGRPRSGRSAAAALSPRRCMTSSRNSCSAARIEISRRPPSSR